MKVTPYLVVRPFPANSGAWRWEVGVVRVDGKADAGWYTFRVLN